MRNRDRFFNMQFYYRMEGNIKNISIPNAIKMMQFYYRMEGTAGLREIIATWARAILL